MLEFLCTTKYLPTIKNTKKSGQFDYPWKYTRFETFINDLRFIKFIQWITPNTTDLLFHIKFAHKEYWSALWSNPYNNIRYKFTLPSLPCCHNSIIFKCRFEHFGALSPQYAVCVSTTTTFHHYLLWCILF